MSYLRRTLTTIATHSGRFHCDEVLACYLLLNTAKYRDATIIRSNDVESIRKCTALVDVGGSYDHLLGRYDHSFPGFKQRPFNSKVLASSLGLVYLHHGIEVITNLTGLKHYKELQIIHERIYFDLLQGIDCIDNGVEMSVEGENYENYGNWWMMVEMWNLPWWEMEDKEKENERFHQAMQAVGSHFNTAVNYYLSNWLPGRFIVEQAYYTRTSFHPSGRFLLLPESCSWKGHLSELQIWHRSVSVLYCVYPNADRYAVQFAQDERNPKNESWLFPVNWRGQRLERAEEETGVKGVLFVHKRGYIAFVKDLEAARELCEEVQKHLKG